MAHNLELAVDRLRQNPLILIIPGIDSSNAQHWQSRWEAQCRDCQRVNMGSWDNPHRNTWVNKLNLAIHRAQRPVILVAHSLGCLAVAWWAEYEQPAHGNPVVGALLVAPPDVDRPGTDQRLARFGSCPRQPLPFPSFLVASQDDRFCTLRTAQMLASDWGCRFEFAGAIGHINSESGIGDWQFGKKLLAQLLREHQLEQGTSDPANLTKRRGSLDATRERTLRSQRVACQAPSSPRSGKKHWAAGKNVLSRWPHPQLDALFSTE